MIIEIDGSRSGKHERAIVALLGIAVLVVGSGEIDARTALQRGEEGRGDVGTDPIGHSVELLVG